MTVQIRCNIENSNSYGYWTSMIYDHPNSETNVRFVSRVSRLYNYNAINGAYGIRLVITITKSTIQ